MSQTLHEEATITLDPQEIQRGLAAAIMDDIANSEPVPWDVWVEDVYRAWEERRAREKAASK